MQIDANWPRGTKPASLPASQPASKGASLLLAAISFDVPIYLPLSLGPSLLSRRPLSLSPHLHFKSRPTEWPLLPSQFCREPHAIWPLGALPAREREWQKISDFFRLGCKYRYGKKKTKDGLRDIAHRRQTRMATRDLRGSA